MIEVDGREQDSARRTGLGCSGGVVCALELQRPLVAAIFRDTNVEHRVVDVGQARAEAAAPVPEEDAWACANVEFQVAHGADVLQHM